MVGERVKTLESASKGERIIADEIITKVEMSQETGENHDKRAFVQVNYFCLTINA